MCRKCAESGLKDCATCVKSADDLVCKECTGKKFGLNKKSCVTECPDNASEKSGVCTCNDGFTPSTDSSACVAASSSSNLSTGAIAGISVAAVVVVGGLVGFLCWWFICRGKA
ncbi:Variant-specific surface protein [Giardia duodenalis]|uniref:Variant-specific surface protein n=2 Tax=Giardia intestinalis TaxID=5741 RepID=V6TNH7_GIAIN|nr:Variant-specific surface protein [Giardia intestinalis]